MTNEGNNTSEVSLDEATVEDMVGELQRRGMAYIVVAEKVGEPAPPGQFLAAVQWNGCTHKVPALFQALVRRLHERMPETFGGDCDGDDHD